MNILIAANTKFIGPTSVMVYSLCRSHKSAEVDIYLAYHDLEEQDIERLQNIISYFEKKRLHPVDVGNEFASKITVKRHFSYETYYRILVVDLLPKDMERILYLDADMLIKKDLTEVYSTPMSETCPFVVCDDIEGHARGSYESTLDRVAIPYNYKYFNAGFMLMNLSYLRRRDSVGYILDAFYREQNRYPFPDQDVLNHMYYDKVQFVPWSLYNLPAEWWKVDTEALSKGVIRFASYPDMNNPSINQTERFADATLQMRDHAHIIHYLGILKPWLYRDKPMYADVALYAGLWFECEKEMYENIDGLERLQ
ncbi:glycosyltransferase family 8 protein [Candidatus Merdisoma sp. JLR.KK011]|uniref:glycosyltransferase family 8 protein n=1 Tax=Candidatus Merdisoma sp. JLR.KK011 TaxID=3114299 RepID=UPI002FF413B8